MSENKYPIGGYVPVNAENELMYRIIENWGNAVAMPQMEGWIKEYGDKRAEEAKPAGAVWVKASERLPEVVDGKCHPRFVRIERVGHGGNGYAIKAVAYYFPEHFKSVEWEDWDDYNEEDFPYTESDEQRGVVWLKPGWYADIECDACDNSHWSAPLNVIEWLDESGTASNKETPGVKAMYDALTYIYGALIDPVTAKRCSTQMLNKANQAICKYEKELREPGAANKVAIEFAEWCASNYQRDFEPLDSNLPINERKYRQFWIDNDQREYTTADLHQLWQQSKSK